MEIIVNILGWIGTGLFVLGYYLVSAQKLGPTDTSYHLMNLVGAVALGVNVCYYKSWPGLGLEVIWAAIAISSLIKNKRTTKER